MIKIIKGTYGKRVGASIVPVHAGESVALTEDQESRLVKLGVAEYVKSPADQSEHSDTYDEEVESLPAYNDKMKLAELQEIATKYGIDASTMKSKKEVVEAIDAAKEELPDVGGADAVVD